MNSLFNFSNSTSSLKCAIPVELKSLLEAYLFIEFHDFKQCAKNVWMPSNVLTVSCWNWLSKFATSASVHVCNAYLC